MVSIEKLIEYSKKTETEVKQEIQTGIKRLEPIKGMTDSDKLMFVMNELFAKYSKEQFSTGGGAIISGVLLGSYNKQDNVSFMLANTEEFVKKQPEEAKKLCMVDEAGNYLFYETQDKFEQMEDWQIKKRFRAAEPTENALLTTNGKKFIGLPVPKHDYVKYVHGYEIMEDGKQIPFVIKLAYTDTGNPNDKKVDNTDVELPLYQVGKFKVFKVDSQSTDNFSYYTGSGVFKFEFVRALEDKEVEQFVTTQLDKIVPLSNFDTIAGTVKRTSYAIFKVRVQDIAMLDSGGYVFKVYDDTIELGENDAKGNKIVPFTVYPPEGYKPIFSDGAEIFVFGNPYVSSRQVRTISACGIHVNSIYKNLIPASTQSIEL